MSISLTKFQKAALLHLLNRDGILISSIPDANEKNEFDDIVAGFPVYEKLDKIGLVMITEEDPIFFDDEEEPFEFTPSVYLTDEGRAVAQSL